jgi:hypothetical protein
MALVRSIAQFQDKIKAHLSEGNLDAALYSIHRLVDQIFCEPINTAQIFGSKLLDDLCQEVGAVNLYRLRSGKFSLPDNDKQANNSENVVVYVVSKLQASGGHTAVLADIIRLAPPARSVILVTGIGGITDQESIQHRFDFIQNVSFEYAPRGIHIDKLDWLQRKILALKPTDVWLFNHHQDSVAVAAVQPNAGYQLHFYHHGDHHLCLGVHLSYADHVDIHPMGYHYCREELNIKDNRYLPMAVEDMGDRPETSQFKCGADLVTCTAAGFNKVEVPYFIRYVDVIPELLHASGGKHIHIGRLTTLALRRIRSSMRRLGLHDSKFIYIPFVPSVWKALHEYKVDLYITSFPYGGARTLIEVMGAGVPIAAHSHCTSRLLGTFDMAYEGAFVWRNPQELYHFVKKLDAEHLESFSKLARKRYLDFHSEQILINALALNAEHLQAPPLYSGYVQDSLQHALDISNQVSCFGAIRRFLYRTYRSWKSFIA